MSKEALHDKDIVCLGHLKRAFDLVDRLHDVGCQRDLADNRELHFDDYLKLMLLYTWNPLIGSIRRLQEAVGLSKVAKALGIKSFSLGSFSESVRVFEPERVREILVELAGQITPGERDPRLKEFKDAITLVDGSVVRALARLARSAVGIEARINTGRDGVGVYAWRLHAQLELDTFTARIERTGARNAGDNREANVLKRNLEAGRCYVGDGHYGEQGVFKAITDAQSSYVLRMADNSVFSDIQIEERELSPQAIEAGIVRDAVAYFDGVGMVRRIEIKVTPHIRRSWSGAGTGKKRCDRLILYTSLLEMPAELIGVIYRYRYTVEHFFFVLKQMLGLRHLLSQREEGIDIQIYCAMIVCVLIQLISGKKPNKALRSMVGWYLLDVASEQELINFLNKPDNTGVKKRAKAELLKKMGF
jgi:Transposase DDE domain